jgi:ABC-2 type transport system ATP-binding protein
MSIAIDVRQIVKKFGGFTAVDGISFSVEAGEVFGLLGPNGAGKSTLIRMLTTLLPPTAGTAVINGFDVVTRPDDVRRAIGVIPQAMTSDLELSVEENLLIFAKLYGVSRERRMPLIGDLLEAVELTQWRHSPVKNLSGGMRRRVEIARGLVHEPRVFFLDEPTTGLDPRGRRTVWQIIRGLAADGVTIFLTTQYLDEADQLADRIAVLDHGRIVAEGTASELKRRIPGGHIRLQFTGPRELESAADVLGAVSRDDGALTLQVPSDGNIASLRALLDRLDGAQVEVGGLSIHTPDLDDVFFSLTGSPTTKENQR